MLIGLDSAPVFPPTSGQTETRYCIGEKIVFLLDSRQRREYFRPLEASSTVAPPTNAALYVGAVRMHRAWHDEDVKHAARGGRWNVYILRMADGSYYVGQSRKPPEERFGEHKSGIGAKVCRERGVERLVYFTEVASRQIALEAESFLVSALRKIGMNATQGDSILN